MHLATGLLVAALSVAAFAALPPPSDEAKAKAAATAEKASWAAKVQAYELCKVEDRLAGQYRQQAQSAGKTGPAALPTPACSDPGPFAVGTAAAKPKPIEASEAHSPAATSVAPPSTPIPAAALPASGNP
jgi:hypothetical protein